MVLGKTYFFKGKSFWQFDDLRKHVTSEKPELSAVRWMKCSRKSATYSNEVYDDEEQHKEPLTSKSTVQHAFTNPLFIIFCMILISWQNFF